MGQEELTGLDKRAEEDCAKKAAMGLKDVACMKEAAELMKSFLQQDADGPKALTANVDEEVAAKAGVRRLLAGWTENKEWSGGAWRPYFYNSATKQTTRTRPVVPDGTAERAAALRVVQFRAFKAMLKFKKLCDEHG
jgi:hypothetical protein